MRRIVLGLLICLFCTGSPLAEVPSGGPAPLGMGTYPQTILVTFKSEEAAHKASLRIVPLFHDAKAAFSTRMDDNNIDALKVSEVMAEFGQKGTFFLNDPKGWQGSPDAGITVSGDPGVEVPRRLLAAGDSIGGHTLTHEFLPALSKNSAFKEILGIRIKRETLNKTTLSCFTYPFVSFHCEGMDPHDRDDLEEMLRRSGFYLLSENRYNGGVERGFYDGYFVTSDGQSWNGSEVEGELTKDRPDDDRPLFLVAMHPWVAAWGGKDFPKLAEVYRKWGNHRDWWYCNQNQYAAYRAQALHSKMETSVQGKTLKVVLTRPLPSDLGDRVPLTMEVEGAKPNQVAGLVCDGVRIKRVETDKSYRFDLDHDKAYGFIEAFGELSQSGNVERVEDVKAGPGGLKAVLNRSATGLSLVLQNGGEGVLRDARVTFRLPLRWKEGVVREGPVSLVKGVSVTLDLKLTEREDAVHYKDGSEFLVAQVDYFGDKPSRLYVTQETPAREAASYYSKNGFRVLGPLPGDLEGFDPVHFASGFMRGKNPVAGNPVSWGGDLTWKTPEGNSVSMLDPDIIPTTGRGATPDFYKWDSSFYFPHKKVHYLLWGQVESSLAQKVRAVFIRDSVKAMSLDGKEVEGEDLLLKKGINDLRILYAPAANQWSEFSEKNYGCYFRLVDENGNRLENVSFVRPPVP